MGGWRVWGRVCITAGSRVEGSGRDPGWELCGLGALGASGWAESGRLYKRGPGAAPGVPAISEPYLAAAGGGGEDWAGAGAAWTDRTPSGDSADVTAAGSTPGGRR